MTQKEFIEKAYGKHWEIVKDFVDENGNCCMIDYSKPDIEIKNHPPLNDLGFNKDDGLIQTWYDSNQFKHFWRPIILNEIEHNNGWLKIESESDLPKEFIECEFIIAESEVASNFGEIYTGYYMGTFFKGRIRPEAKITSFNFWMVSHYKPKTESKKPIY